MKGRKRGGEVEGGRKVEGRRKTVNPPPHDFELWTLSCELGSFDSWGDILRHLEESHRETQEKLGKMQTVIQSLVAQQQQQRSVKKIGRLQSRDLYLMVLVLALSHIVVWLYWKKWFSFSLSLSLSLFLLPYFISSPLLSSSIYLSFFLSLSLSFSLITHDKSPKLFFQRNRSDFRRASRTSINKKILLSPMKEKEAFLYYVLCCN